MLSRLKKSRKTEVETPIGRGTSERCADHGEVFKVHRYHRGSVIDFMWPPSHPAALSVPETAAKIQDYIDKALELIDSDADFREDVMKNGGIYPISVYWGRDDCDFSISFGYAGWPDGILRLFFRGGEVVDTDVSD